MIQSANIVDVLKKDKEELMTEYNRRVQGLEGLLNQINSINTLILKHEPQPAKQPNQDAGQSTGNPIPSGQAQTTPAPDSGADQFDTTEGGQSSGTPSDPTPTEPTIGPLSQPAPLKPNPPGQSAQPPTNLEPGVRHVDQGTLPDSNSKHNGSVTTTFITQKRKVGSPTEDSKPQ